MFSKFTIPSFILKAVRTQLVIQSKGCLIARIIFDLGNRVLINQALLSSEDTYQLLFYLHLFQKN